MTTFPTEAGLRLAYDVMGEGPPLVLVGGLSADRAFWAIARPLLAGFTTLAFDHRDVGHSDRAEGAYGVADMAEDTLAVMDAAGLERAHILGHSLGGAVAQELALRAPERVDRLILACTFARNDVYSASVMQLLKRLRAEVGDPATYISALATFTLGRTFLEANALKDIANMVVAAGPLQEVAAFCRQADAGLAVDTRDRLGAITAPTLVLATPEDRIFAPHFSADVAAGIPGAQLVEIPGSGHCPMIETPQAFAEVVTGFLQEA